MSPRMLAVAGALAIPLAGSYAVVSGIWSRPAVPSPASHAVVVAELFTSDSFFQGEQR